MKLKIFSSEVYVSFLSIAFLSLSIICDKKGTVVLCIFASILHEAGHILLMLSRKVRVKSIRLNLGDVAINADFSTVSLKDEVLITFGGVIVNFTLSASFFLLFCLFKYRLMFDFAVVNLLLGIFNILPVRNLDGGDLLLLFLNSRLSARLSDIFCDIATVVFLFPVAVFGFISLFNSSFNYSLLFASLYLICTLVSKEFRNVSKGS